MTRTARPNVVLYNPRAVFHTMPLALLAIASRLDRTRYDVQIIDGRLEDDPAARVVSALGKLGKLDGAVCFGVSVLTGAPIRDALDVSRAVRAAHPDLPIVWGGWHPSLFPADCLRHPAIDAVVIGQGEDTFAELVDRLAAGESLDGCRGVAFRRDGQVVTNPPRPLGDLNQFPSHRYELTEVERYFKLKRRRQLDYISSQGCRFRCGFCADPAVYQRGWTGLSPERVVDDLYAAQRRYEIDEVSFQDETFFTSATRVDAIAEGLLRHDVHVTWTATLRADQSARLSEDTFAKAVRSGLRRVMIGVESGSQALLDWMHKDVTVEQVLLAAERCSRHGVDAIFNFIVGFPGETDAQVDETLQLVKTLRSRHAGFDTPIFYFRPYPGSAISEAAQATGYRSPEGLEAWADFDYVAGRGPWVDEARWRKIEGFKFYARQAWTSSPWRWPLRMAARWRCEHDRYGFPVEQRVVEWLRPPQQVS